ncbi:MAG: conjugal transfer protein TraF [candidate division NC10 bacterium]|nr:conjugal transfer protein TraF [candidate division NC10 bacterium]
MSTRRIGLMVLPLLLLSVASVYAEWPRNWPFLRSDEGWFFYKDPPTPRLVTPVPGVEPGDSALVHPSELTDESIIIPIPPSTQEERQGASGSEPEPSAGQASITMHLVAPRTLTLAPVTGPALEAWLLDLSDSELHGLLVGAKAADLRTWIPLLLDQALTVLDRRSVKKYLLAQQESLRRSDVFSKLSQEVVWTDPTFDRPGSMPTGGLAQAIYSQDKAATRSQTLSQIRESINLLLVVGPDCMACEAQWKILKTWADTSGFTVRPITSALLTLTDSTIALPYPQIISRLDVRELPSLYLVEPANGYITRLGSGLLSEEEIVTRILRLVPDQQQKGVLDHAALPNAVSPPQQNILHTESVISVAIVSLVTPVGCGSTKPPADQLGSIQGPPIVTTTSTQRMTPVPMGLVSGPGAPQGGSRQATLGPLGAPGTPLGDGATVEARLRQLDDHYARNASETRELVQQALTTVKASPTTMDFVALKAALTRLEGQVTRLTTASARTENTLTGVTTRIQQVERAASEKEAERVAIPTTPLLDQPSPPSPSKSSAVAPTRPSVDPDEESFNRALEALSGPTHATEPMRAFLELHPTHVRAPEALFQLGMFFLNQNYPVAANFYFRRLIAEYPLTLQAKEAKEVKELPALLDTPPGGTPKSAVHRKAKSPARPVAKVPPAVTLPTLSSPSSTAPAPTGLPKVGEQPAPAGQAPPVPKDRDTKEQKSANGSETTHLLIPAPATQASTPPSAKITSPVSPQAGQRVP